MSIFPEKLKRGDKLRVVAPARSLQIAKEDTINIANRRFEELGLEITLGKYVKESDEFSSSSIESRVTDIHDAFIDKDVKGVFAVIGGFNSNQLLRYLDYDLIKNNPKVFCGFSDITALQNAIFAKTGLVTYSGPHYLAFGEELYFEYTLEYFRKCLMSEDEIEINPSKEWNDDRWYEDQINRSLIKNNGFLAINEGEADGAIIGGNLCTLNLLQGTEYFPLLKNSILFIEDDYESLPHTFDRDLQSIIHLPEFNGVKGIVIGRFQKASKMTEELLFKIIKSKSELKKLPVIANVDFGHTNPKITFPIGGSAEIKVAGGDSFIRITKH